MAWTLHGEKAIKKRPVGMGARNKEKIASPLRSNKLPVFLASRQQAICKAVIRNRIVCKKSKMNSEW